MKVLAGVVAVVVAFPATASATTFTATASSPRNPALDASVDLSQVTATYDTAGTVTVDMRVFGGFPSGITGTLYAAAPGGGCGAAVASIVRDASGNESASVTPPNAPPHQVSSPSFTLTNAQFVGTISDPGLAGLTPGCVTATTANSSGGVLDTVSSSSFAETTPPPPPPPPPPGPKPHRGGLLIANRRGVVAIKIGRFSSGLSGTVRIRSARRTLGHKTFRVTRGGPVTVRVRLNAATRRRLAPGRKLQVTIHVRGHAPGVKINITYPATILRR